MTMPTFVSGVPQSIYTLTDLRVARWDGTEYGTVVSLAEGQTLQFEPQADTDQKKSYGVVTRLLSVFTSVNVTIGVGLIQANAWWTMVGVDQSETGESGEETQSLGIDGGGAGLPYFGVVGNFASDDAGDVVIGIPRVKLDAPPSLSSEQNQFILPESSAVGIANLLSANPRRILWIDQNKVAKTITNFNTFFKIS
jgi:hypothetical protein